jgi:hypothetical protein
MRVSTVSPSGETTDRSEAWISAEWPDPRRLVAFQDDAWEQSAVHDRAGARRSEDGDHRLGDGVAPGARSSCAGACRPGE